MREMNFSKSNLGNRWLGVKSIWRQIQGEVKRVIKFQIERALVLEQRDKVGCGRYKRSEGRQGYRNGSYVRDLLTSYGWIDRLVIPRVRDGGIESKIY
jgi:transposase-like protein